MSNITNLSSVPNLNIHYFNLEFREKNNLPFFASFPFYFDGKPLTEISCGISSRFSGDMKYSEQNENRLNLFNELGLDPKSVYGLKQIHSHTVLTVDKSNPSSQQEGDGLITQDGTIALSVTVADCLPVYLFDTKTKAFALLHSGWKGTGIVLKAINLMEKQYGTKPKNVAAVLGPCIDSCCYKVDTERATTFEKQFGPDSVRRTGNETFLDLKTANIKLLEKAGVKNISVCKDCTFKDERLGSYRREGQNLTHMLALLFWPI